MNDKIETSYIQRVSSFRIYRKCTDIWIIYCKFAFRFLHHFTFFNKFSVVPETCYTEFFFIFYFCPFCHSFNQCLKYKKIRYKPYFLNRFFNVTSSVPDELCALLFWTDAFELNNAKMENLGQTIYMTRASYIIKQGKSFKSDMKDFRWTHVKTRWCYIRKIMCKLKQVCRYFRLTNNVYKTYGILLFSTSF